MTKTILIFSLLVIALVAVRPSAGAHHAIQLQSHKIDIYEIMTDNLAAKVNGDLKSGESKAQWEARIDSQFEEEMKKQLDSLKLTGANRKKIETQLRTDWTNVKVKAWQEKEKYEQTLTTLSICFIVLVGTLMMY